MQPCAEAKGSYPEIEVRNLKELRAGARLLRAAPQGKLVAPGRNAFAGR